MTSVSAVKANNITGEKPSHECGQWGRSRTKKKVGMIRQKSPSITACLRGGAAIPAHLTTESIFEHF